MPQSTSPVFDAGHAPSAIAPGSDRTFGLFFAAIFAGLGVWFLWGGASWAWALVALGAATAALAFDRQATTYWIERRPAGPPPETMKNQY